MSELAVQPRGTRAGGRVPWPVQLALAGVVVAGAAAVPVWLSPFWLQTGLFTMAAMVAAIGLTLLVGVAGQLSLGHAFFIAVGAYAYGYVSGVSSDVAQTSGLHLHPLLGILAAVIAAGTAGALGSPISGRLRGIYLGIATLGLVFMGQHLLNNVPKLTFLTGGFNGRDIPTFHLFAFHAQTLKERWWLALVFVALSYWTARNIKRGRAGRAFEAVRDSEIAASTMGVHVGWTKAAAFTVSSMYAGLGGALLAIAYVHIVPDSFNFLYSIDFLAMVVIGGLGSVGGAVLGAAFVTVVPQIFDQYAGAIPFVAPAGSNGFDASTAAHVVYGLAVVVALMFLPNGLAGVGSVLRRAAAASSTAQDRRRHVPPGAAGKPQPTQGGMR